MKRLKFIIVNLLILVLCIGNVYAANNYSPTGCVDVISSNYEGKIYVAGWAFDKDSISQSLTIKAYIGSTCIGTLSANQSRDDVNNAYKISGLHGYSGYINTTYSGSNTVTIKAIDPQNNTEYTIGSKVVTIKGSTTTGTYTTSYDPKGCVDLVQSTENGKIYVAGWAYDQDSRATSIQVKVYIGSTYISTLNADQTREDVNKAFGLTGKHGFSGSISTTLTGSQTVTVKMVDLGTNKEYTITSKTITIKQASSSSTTTYTTNYAPKGCVDLVQSTQAGKIYIAGWAYDLDSKSTSIQVKVYIGSTCLGTMNADQIREDVNNAFGLTGKHGFSGSISTTLTGLQTVTIKMVDLETNKEYTITSKTITIQGSSSTTPAITTNYLPKGCVDSVSSNTIGRIYVSGWVYDPDSSSESLQVKVYIDATCLGTLKADQTREDVNSAYKITGKHGYSGYLDTTLTGSQSVTIKAIDLSTNKEVSIGSKVVTIKSSTSTSTATTNYKPTGCVDLIASKSVKTITVAGWAFDKDNVNESITIKIYNGNTCIGSCIANQAREDVNKAYGITGQHGYSTTISTTLGGYQTITLKAVDLKTNIEYTIGAKDVLITSLGVQGVTLKDADRTVVIDAGHGGSDPGCSYGSNVEEDITLKYALAVGSYLESKGVKVVYTRTGDYELERSSYVYNGVTLTNDLTARAMLAKQYNAALYCSIHIDSASSPAYGFSVFYNPKYEDSKDFANIMLKHLSGLGYTNNRGLLDGTRLRSVRGNTTCTILVELGFINSSDITYINNNVTTLSHVVGDAIIDKLNQGWISPNTTIVSDLS